MSINVIWSVQLNFTKPKWIGCLDFKFNNMYLVKVETVSHLSFDLWNNFVKIGLSHNIRAEFTVAAIRILYKLRCFHLLIAVSWLEIHSPWICRCYRTIRCKSSMKFFCILFVFWMSIPYSNRNHALVTLQIQIKYLWDNRWHSFAMQIARSTKPHTAIFMHNKVCVEQIRAACVTTSRNDKKQIVMTNSTCVFVYSFWIYWTVLNTRY